MQKLMQIETLREASRKLVRELGMLELDQSTTHETPAHWHALIEVSKNPGVTISKVGQGLLLSPSKISRLITRLSKEGLVEMRAGSYDKREKSLYLTDAGALALKKIDTFSENKIKGAFAFLTDPEVDHIIESINLYGGALEKSRVMKESVKILTLSKSRALRQQIVSMIEDIQKGEFSIPITPDINLSVFKGEQHFYYDNTCNFWYAIDANGAVIGSIGLKKVIEQYGELKKFFVHSSYRGKGVAQRLIQTLLKAASKHGFEYLVLGTVDKLHAARRFYERCGFKEIAKNKLPENFDLCPLDTVFYEGRVGELRG
jgi:DNA-binding MarR family transcriptional regulator/N-acetylglutamate synthase-like GNAT family acetyltransferase